MQAEIPRRRKRRNRGQMADRGCGLFLQGKRTCTLQTGEKRSRPSPLPVPARTASFGAEGSGCRAGRQVPRGDVPAQRSPRLAGTVAPLRRNGHPVAPEPPRVRKPRETAAKRANCADALRRREGWSGSDSPGDGDESAPYLGFVSAESLFCQAEPDRLMKILVRLHYSPLVLANKI